MTHGYKRAEILSTHFNGATLLVLALLIPTRASRASSAPTGIASLIIAAIMLSAAYGLLKASGRRMDPDTIGRSTAGHQGVREAHDLHEGDLRHGALPLCRAASVSKAHRPAPAPDEEQARAERVGESG